jgi:hypothetical protein
MSINHLLIAISIFNITGSLAQNANIDENYVNYHKKINRAETLFFMKDEVDSALTLYDEVFKKYDFIFVKDFVNAAQIAHFSHKPYKKYIKKGFKFGLKLEHLKNYPLFKYDLAELRNDKALQQTYALKRKDYLKNIDFNYLDWIYDLFIKDQFDKSKPDYEDIISISLKLIKSKIEQKGFPGERVLGIGDSIIFAEHGIPQLDLKEQIKKYGEELWYVETEDKALSQTKIFVLLVHHHSAYIEMKKVLWKQMKKGNIHPRDIGLVFDNMYRFSNGRFAPFNDDPPKNRVFFRLNLFTDYPEKTIKNVKTTNALRKSFNIVPLAVDNKKKELEKKYGFVLFSGYWDCR